MAADGLLFRWVASVHPQRGTPHVAIALQAVWSSALVFTGTYRALFTRVVYTEWIFFALMAASLWFLRARSSYTPEYRVPAGRFLSAVFVISSLAIVAHEVAAHPRDSAWGLAIVAAGLPVYWLWTRGRRTSSPTPSSAPGS
jgi:APA family basic amino acid/polyamine antiporter